MLFGVAYNNLIEQVKHLFIKIQISLTAWSGNMHYRNGFMS